MAPLVLIVALGVWHELGVSDALPLPEGLPDPLLDPVRVDVSDEVPVALGVLEDVRVRVRVRVIERVNVLLGVDERVAP